MSGKSVIDTPKPLAEHADKAVKVITFLYLPAKDVLVKDTLRIHMIKRFFNERNISYLQFFKMATDEKSFFTQFYGKEFEVIKKLLLMITIAVYALETMNQLKNGLVP